MEKTSPRNLPRERGKLTETVYPKAALCGFFLLNINRPLVFLSGLNYERCNFSVVNNNLSIKCTYFASVSLIYTEFPGVPVTQELVTKILTGTATISPERDSDNL